ncbi:small subunit methyltransferase G [Seminavis robusta]|uniref:Small subunit methyltransferase G n=1 Tax=Seminavis robusta TaxID=568900 RepID=A0A9N8HSY0_9STRA|nr:small subunit methyltransferase G [Seminavis robusta]|eukprot:Sro1442_g273050.1 small subunit methyltransferase G (284) ;mRNA; f:16079-16930
MISLLLSNLQFLLLLLIQALSSSSLVVNGFETSSLHTPRRRLFSLSATTDDALDFRLDPYSEFAHSLLSERLGLSPRQQEQVQQYCEMIVEWNQKINLVSRKDCSLEVVFGRHVLPCLAPTVIVELADHRENHQKIVDVGTGGGFPGIPMAIALPSCQFVLVDSVGKKLTAVHDMVTRLGLTNVETMHARAEQVHGSFDWCVGRSVASLPKYCGWMHHLLKPDTGKLLYIIGGQVPEGAEQDYGIQELLLMDGDDNNNAPVMSEKRILIFGENTVGNMAKLDS